MELVYSDQIKEELSKLKESDQRHKQIMKGIAKICLAPHKTDNLINSLKPYRAEKAAPQIRIFYEIISEKDVIFLTWVNPVAFPHNTNDGQENDPCYKEFTRLYNNALLQKYTPLPEPAEAEFSMSAGWGEASIYCKLKKDKDFTDSHLALQQTGKNEYEITHFSSQATYYHDELEILLKMIEAARGYKICLTYQLHLILDQVEINEKRKSLITAGLELVASDRSIELWQIDVE